MQKIKCGTVKCLLIRCKAGLELLGQLMVVGIQSIPSQRWPNSTILIKLDNSGIMTKRKLILLGQPSLLLNNIASHKIAQLPELQGHESSKSVNDASVLTILWAV